MDEFNEEELTEEEMENKAETEELPEPPADNSENAEGEFEANTVGKTLVAVGKKSVIDLLLKKYKFATILAIGIVIGLFFVLLAVFTGAGVPEYEYVAPTCEQVTVVYEPYGEDEERTVVMDMEKYVKEAVYAYTEDFSSEDIYLYHLYSSLSIALRTEALTKNCRVTYRDKELREPTQENQDIERALERTAGLVMVDENGNFINTSVSDFCWSSKNEQAYELYQNLAIPLEFSNVYFDNEIYSTCPCNDEQGDPTDEENEYSMCWSSNEEDAEWLHQDETNGYSVYGAYYLAIGQSYLDDSILNHFFGENVYLKTIIKNKSENQTDDDFLTVNNSNCMWWPIGSDETTTSNGVILASGTPSTTAITSDFGARPAPIAGASTYHRAIDIGNGVEGKTNIIAAASGKVIAANTGCTAGNSSCGGQLGNYVKIEHPDGTVTRYGHMFSVNVQNGDSVVQGQVIGTMGNTGNSTGPHLDFQVLVNGTAVNPLNYVDPENPRKLCSPIISEGGSNKQTVCLNLLRYSNTYSLNALTGIMANLQAESNFNPRAINSSSGAYGLVQWLFERKTGVMNACSPTLSDNEYISCQVDYIFQELATTQGKTNSYLLTDASPADMAFYVCQYYERPGIEICNSGTRQGYANDLINYMSNGCQ